MNGLSKDARLTVRFSPVQLADLDSAAKIESQRRGEIVEPSTLLRELCMSAVRDILDSPPSS